MRELTSMDKALTFIFNKYQAKLKKKPTFVDNHNGDEDEDMQGASEEGYGDVDMEDEDDEGSAWDEQLQKNEFNNVSDQYLSDIRKQAIEEDMENLKK